MRKEYLLFGLIIFSSIASAQVFTDIPSQNAINSGNIYYLQKSQEQANGHIRGIIGQGIIWDAATDLWEVNNGGKSSNDFSMIAFGNGGDIVFYNRLKLDGSTYTMSNSSLNGYKSMTINGDGNVGIGTADPLEKLHVVGNATIIGDIIIDYGKALKVDTDWNGNGESKIFQTGWESSRGDFLDFYVPGDNSINQSARLTILKNGNVGVGTLDPAHALDVNGGGRFTESLSLGTDSNAGLKFGNSWNAYSSTDNDSYVVTHSGSGGAEMEIVNIDGTVANAVTIFKSKVGIGVGTPSEKLEINGKIGLHSNGDIYQLGSSVNSTTGVSVRSITNPVNGDNLFTVESAGSGSRLGVTQAHGAWITDGLRIGAQFNSNMPDLESGLIVDGKVGIGITTPSEKLEVNGTIRSKEVKVEASPWPDYVFSPTYNLRSLEETEAFIKENNHLPEIPSAEEVEENGIQLGEMNALLLKKIEELTLYQIELLKRIEKLEEKSRN